MMTWLLGLGLGGGAIAMMLLPGIIRVLTPVLTLAAEAALNYFRACWHGITTGNYGTWTLIITAFAAGWFSATCPEVGTKKDTPAIAGKGVVTAPEGSAQNDFCHWFGC